MPWVPYYKFWNYWPNTDFWHAVAQIGNFDRNMLETSSEPGLTGKALTKQGGLAHD